jgi:hypothetical protein
MSAAGYLVCRSETHGVHFLGGGDAWVLDLFSARVFDSHLTAERTRMRVGGDCAMPVEFAWRHLKPPVLRVHPAPGLVRR